MYFPSTQQFPALLIAQEITLKERWQAISYTFFREIPFRVRGLVRGALGRALSLHPQDDN